MQRILNWLHRLWLQHEAATLAAAIHDEELRHRQHGERLDYWLRELARVKSEIAFLERPNIGLSSGLLAGMGKRLETPAKGRFVSPRMSADIAVTTIALPRIRPLRAVKKERA